MSVMLQLGYFTFYPINVMRDFGVPIWIVSPTTSNYKARDSSEFSIVNCAATRVTLQEQKNSVRFEYIHNKSGPYITSAIISRMTKTN